MKPRLLLRIEGLAVLATACVFYQESRASWLWFGVLFIVPDISMLGYLSNKKLGASVYNLFHTYTSPFIVVCTLWLTGQASHYAWLPLILFAHIGFDRMLGYGLKYETAFKDTHFQRV